jgi:hypothetical protein
MMSKDTDTQITDEEAAVYQPPTVYKGQMVIWYTGLGGEGSPAIVTGIGGRAIAVSVTIEGFANFHTTDGVLHVSDPLARDTERDEGVWDYTDEHKHLLQVLNSLLPQAGQKARKTTTTKAS